MHANGYLPLSGEVAASKADGGVVLFCNSTLFVEEPFFDTAWEEQARPVKMYSGETRDGHDSRCQTLRRGRSRTVRSLNDNPVV